MTFLFCRQSPKIAINLKRITVLLESNGNQSIFSMHLPKAVMDYSNVNLDASITIFINSRVKIVLSNLTAAVY